jgi:hypothetical protein
MRLPDADGKFLQIVPAIVLNVHVLEGAWADALVR